MMAQLIDRKQLKQQMKDLLRSAQVGARGMTLLYLALVCALNLTDSLTGLVNDGLPAMFVSILTSLLGMVLSAGFVLYCMAVRRGERAEYLTLFDGFSFVGRIILLNIVEYLFIFLWSLLFVIPGIIAAYRYRFALYNLCENPDIGIWEALDISKRQTMGYKGQLLFLDLSYLGWTLLAGIPSMIYSIAFYQLLLQEMASLYGFVFQPAAWASIVSLLPGWGWTLVMGVWNLAVSLFYLPAYQCVELGYFETAKTTSGVGSGAASNQGPSFWGRRDGPDDLGGY